MRTTTIGASSWRQTWRSSLAWTAIAAALAAALLALALSAPPAKSAERSATTAVTGGKTLLKLDGDTAAVLTDAGISIQATGPAIGPAGSPVFAFPIVGGQVNTRQLSGKIIHSGGLAITAGDTTLVVKRFVIDPRRGRIDRQGSRSGRADTAAAPRCRWQCEDGPRAVGAEGCQRQTDRHGGRGVERDVRHRPLRGGPADWEGHRHRPHRALERFAMGSNPIASISAAQHVSISAFHLLKC